MYRRFKFAVSAATVLVALIVCAAASAASGPLVKVRVESATHTLLPNTKTQTTTGSITKFGAPPGKCSSTSGAGALDVATNGNWFGTFSKSFGEYFITTILGDKESGTTTYWGIWVDYKFATTGVCGIKLNSGDQLLFAVDSVAHHEFPVALSTSGKRKVGHVLKVKVVWYSDAGVAMPLAGAHVFGGKLGATTNSKGIAKLHLKRAGTLKLHAEKTGYIRAAVMRVKVSR
jgi:hypothetical protein